MLSSDLLLLFIELLRERRFLDDHVFVFKGWQQVKGIYA